MASYNLPNILRTPYDQLMNRVYNPNNVALYPAPWPMEKTLEDQKAQKQWCISDCGNFQNYPNPNAYSMNASDSDGISVGQMEGYYYGKEDSWLRNKNFKY